MKQNNMLAMILAGGRGSRLHELTNKVAKPAVSYGGKYRIVDFPLSNCANSGVDIVGVLTQYESVLLNSYVAAGGRWGLDARESGVLMQILTFTEVLLTRFLRISILSINILRNIF
jgi:glucose-1-phosphate adenylyltransferase